MREGRDEGAPMSLGSCADERPRAVPEGWAGGGPTPDVSERAKKPPRSDAYAKAVALLTRREHSRRELARKLAARGIEAGEAEAALDALAEQGWQSQDRFAESLARTRAAAGYGPVRIRAELETHGLTQAEIQAALAACDTDWEAAARALVARRYPAAALADPARRRKAIDFLLRRGFEPATAFAALRS